MAHGRNDRDFPFRDRDDDRQRLAGRWVQDDETGYLRRRFDDDGDDNEPYPGSRGRQDYDDQQRHGNAGGYYGQSNRRPNQGGGHAFDFARRDSGRSELGGRVDDRFYNGQDRFGDRGYTPSSAGFDRGYDDRTRWESTGGSPRGGWPQDGNSINRYVSAEGYPENARSGARTGSFRGKGPKGYVRSDERIKEDVSDRLSDDDTLDASDITVEVSGGEVTLSGYVDSRQAKRSAEQCAGVTHVQNNLRVLAGGGADQDPTRSGTDLLNDRAKATDV